MRSIFACLLLLAWAYAQEPLWIAVGPAELIEPLGPLVEHRRAQGLAAHAVAGTIEDALKRKPTYLVVVGDHERMPAKEVSLYRWRAVQPGKYASDAAWADRDGDTLPDFAVGRIPARTPAQVRVAVAKTLAYETRERSLHDLRVAVWAGAPGYGAAVDALATTLLVTTVRQHAPVWASPWLISGDARQPLCGWPPDQPAKFADMMREGSLINAVAAHGNADGIFSMRHEGIPVWFTAANAGGGAADAPTAPLVFLACNCGELDRKRPSIAETLFLRPGGPVATVGATTESHPLTNYFTGVAMLKALAGKYGAVDRLGDLWLVAQRRAVAERNMLVEATLRDVEGKLEPKIDTDALRRDQQRMYTLFGDPALRLPLPGKLEAKIEKKADGGWKWTVRCPQGATHLHAQFRDVATPPRPVAPDATKEVRRELFQAANAAEGFKPVCVVEGSEMGGEGKGAGQLRLIAIGPGLLQVTVFEVR